MPIQQIPGPSPSLEGVLPGRGGAGVVLVEEVHAAGRPDVPQPHLRCAPPPSTNLRCL